jgi:hypothetical protein
LFSIPALSIPRALYSTPHTSPSPPTPSASRPRLRYSRNTSPSARPAFAVPTARGWGRGRALSLAQSGGGGRTGEPFSSGFFHSAGGPPAGPGLPLPWIARGRARRPSQTRPTDGRGGGFRKGGVWGGGEVTRHRGTRTAAPRTGDEMVRRGAERDKRARIRVRSESAPNPQRHPNVIARSRRFVLVLDTLSIPLLEGGGRVDGG